MVSFEDMKKFLFAIVLLVLIGIAGFFYRNALEHPIGPVATSTVPTACTLEAKVCPDGTSVGRTGPSCAFAPCLPPNVELPLISIAFALPSGYSENKNATGNDASLVASYQKASEVAGSFHTILVRRYPIPAGATAESVMLANTLYESSGKMPTSMKEFSPVIVNGKTFYSIVLERFEGQVHSAYYLTRANDVLRFEVLERDVTNWTDSTLIVANLPAHQALLKMLSTLSSP